MDPNYFMTVCGEGGSEFVKATRLSKAKFKTFLMQRYGPAIAEKFQNLFDWSQALDFTMYALQLEQILKNKDVMYQIGFDFFDANNDEKISELDLFRVFQAFGKDKHYKDLFDSSVHLDLTTMVKLLKWMDNERNTK